MPNSRFALHGLAPVCAPFLPLIHGLYAPFSGPLLTPVSRAPFCQPLSSRFALHGLHALDLRLELAQKDS